MIKTYNFPSNSSYHYRIGVRFCIVSIDMTTKNIRVARINSMIFHKKIAHKNSKESSADKPVERPHPPSPSPYSGVG